MKRKFLTVIVALICVAACVCALVACNDDSDTVDVASVALDKSSLTLEVGGEATLTATVTPDNATDKTVVWSSDNTAVATVENGKVTAVASGSATVTAKAGDKTATCAVTVNAKVNYEVTATQWNELLSSEVKAATMTSTSGNGDSVVKFDDEKGYLDIMYDYEYRIGVSDSEFEVKKGRDYIVFCQEEGQIYKYAKEDTEDNVGSWQKTGSSEAERTQYRMSYAEGIEQILVALADKYSEFTYSDNAYTATDVNISGIGVAQNVSFVFVNGALSSVEIIT